MIDRSRVHEGMVVRSSDGKELGRVLACGERTFVIEKGFHFATHYVARYDDATGISGDEIRLSRPQQELECGERAFTREGGLGESFALGIGTSLDTPPSEPWVHAEEEEEERRRAGVRGDEDEPGAERNMGAGDGLPPSYGDEGGGGLL